LSAGLRRALAAAVLAAAALPFAACATCKPERPPIEPRVGGGVSVGTGGMSSGLGLGIDVSNLFCRQPDPETQPRPGPADEPIKDLPPARPQEGQGGQDGSGAGAGLDDRGFVS
jgi:hypothetical protein